MAMQIKPAAILFISRRIVSGIHFLRGTSDNDCCRRRPMGEDNGGIPGTFRVKYRIPKCNAALYFGKSCMT